MMGSLPGIDRVFFLVLGAWLHHNHGGAIVKEIFELLMQTVARYTQKAVKALLSLYHNLQLKLQLYDHLLWQPVHVETNLKKPG